MRTLLYGLSFIRNYDKNSGFPSGRAHRLKNGGSKIGYTPKTSPSIEFICENDTETLFDFIWRIMCILSREKKLISDV